MHDRAAYLWASGSTAITGASVAGLLRAVNWVSVLTFAGSAVCSVLAWYQAQKSEAARAERDRELASLLKRALSSDPGAKP